MSETPDELRARLGALAEAATERPWGSTWAGNNLIADGFYGLLGSLIRSEDLAFIAALVNSWPAIDALLARLSAAEPHRYTQISTVDAIDRTVVDAMVANDGWELLGTGLGSDGQTTLTFAWPALALRDPS